jgi:hypothetical protein
MAGEEIKRQISLLFILFALVGCGNPTQSPEPGESIKAPIDLNQEAEPFAVIELFSSEGCNDCPPAEEFLNELTRQAMAEKSYVYPLAFHVDYWNKLGWKDVFSDSSFSNRQRKYRKAFGNEVVYTPQMIINGSVEFTGSDRKRAKKVIDSVLAIKPEVFFSIHPDSAGKTVSFQIIKGPENLIGGSYLISFATVQRNLKTKVERGENAGKTLEHQNVVISFKTYYLSNMSGNLSTGFDGPLPGKDHSLVALIQKRETMEILGANLWNY